MRECKLKYGCNPDQKAARIFMRDDSELPLTILNGRLLACHIRLEYLIL